MNTIPDILLPFVLATVVALIIVLPLVRQRLRNGSWAYVARETEPLERLVRRWLIALFAAAATWTALVPALGAERLGVWSAPPLLSWIGIGSVLGGLALIVTAQAQMGSSWRIGIDDAPTSLVTSGSFGMVRHPIYTGVLALVVGVVFVTPAPWTIGGALLVYLLIGIQARLEERHLLAQHGEAYRRWAARVGRFVPGIGTTNATRRTHSKRR